MYPSTLVDQVLKEEESGVVDEVFVPGGVVIGTRVKGSCGGPEQSVIEWAAPHGRRMAEPGATEAYRAAQLAHELGQAVRDLRQQRGWSQADLARAAGMTQSAIARFEAGGTVPTLPVLDRVATALDASLDLHLIPHSAT